jgi:hypothetical protein
MNEQDYLSRWEASLAGGRIARTAALPVKREPGRLKVPCGDIRRREDLEAEYLESAVRRLIGHASIADIAALLSEKQTRIRYITRKIQRNDKAA